LPLVDAGGNSNVEKGHAWVIVVGKVFCHTVFKERLCRLVLFTGCENLGRQAC